MSLKMMRDRYNEDIGKMKLLGLLKNYKPTTPVNCLRCHNRNETDKHFVCKAMCVKALRDAGHTIFTEFKFPNNAVADVYDATLHVVVEFETLYDKKKAAIKFFQFKNYVNEVYVFDIAEMQEHYSQIKKQILYKIGLSKI